MAALVSFGHYLPDTVRTNEEIAAQLGIEPQWIFTATGIRERHIATSEETVVDLAISAATDCLDSGIRADELGLILLASGTAEHRFPGPAAELQYKLPIGKDIPALDIPTASAGSLFALALAADLTKRYGPVLVVASERMSGPAYTEPLTREITPLFGDGAGACIVTPEDRGLTIVDSFIQTDGTFHDSLSLDHGRPIHMDGKQVIMQAPRKLPHVIRTLLERNHVAPEAVSQFIMHQANQNLTDRVAKILNVAPEKFFSNIARYGNTSSASLLIALSEFFRNRTNTPGELFCLAAFGAGFHSGAVLLKQT